MPYVQNSYEGSGALDLKIPNENSISFEGSLAIDIGKPMAWDNKPELISYDGTSTWPTIYDPSIDEPLVDLITNGPEQYQNLNANKIIISVCSTLGIIIIAALVGFSFTKRPCSPEYIYSARTGTSTNPETQPSTTIYNTTANMELTNIAITVGH